MRIIIALLVLAVLILVHEYGHFTAARRVGIKIEEFSIGFGPRVGGWQKDGIVYSVRAFPLGGFVRMLGEDMSDDNNRPDSYMAKTPLQKIRVAFAGPLFNFLLAIVLFVYSFTFVGMPEASSQAIVGDVVAGQPAEKAGLKPNDRILEINEVKVSTWNEMVAELQKTESGQDVTLLIDRKGNESTVTVKPAISDGRQVLGIRSSIEFKKLPVLTGVSEGFKQTYLTTVLLLQGLVQMLTGKVSGADIAGPVGITKMIGDAAASGMVYLVNFAALLSINLGVLNLLPIPALDGSKICFSAIEAIRKRPIPAEKENFIHLLGFIFLIGLIILVTFNDIMRLVRG
jgi:regulator of sigma E protease